MGTVKLRFLLVILPNESSVHCKIENVSNLYALYAEIGNHENQLSNSNFELGTFLARMGTKSGTPNILQLCSLYMTMQK